MSSLTEVPSTVPRSVVVTVGDELLRGDTVDTNAARAGRVLAELGAPVSRRETVGDDASAIAAAVTRGLSDADLVLVTGGLGPTPDDLTREAVADVLGAPMRLDSGIATALRERFSTIGRHRFPARNLAQAMVPEGARVLPNERGTAPGLALDQDGRWVVLLPGIPHELEGMLVGPVTQLVREAFGGRLRRPHHRMIRTTGIAESRLAERVEALLPRERGPMRIAYLPSFRGVDIRLTVSGETDEEEALRWFDRAETDLRELERYRFVGDDLVSGVARALERAGETVAVAESCTGGLLAKRLTDRPGSSRWFLGGVVAYADAVKTEWLGVPAELIRAEGAVSEQVARALAVGAARAFGADGGVGITGIAGPGGGTPDKPVGTVWYAAVQGDRAVAERRVFPGDREVVRERSAQAALHLLYRLLNTAS